MKNFITSSLVAITLVAFTGCVSEHGDGHDRDRDHNGPVSTTTSTDHTVVHEPGESASSTEKTTTVEKN